MTRNQKSIGIAGVALVAIAAALFALRPYTCQSAQTHQHDHEVTITAQVVSWNECELEVTKDGEQISLFADFDPVPSLVGQTVTVNYDQTCGQVGFLKY